MQETSVIITRYVCYNVKRPAWKFRTIPVRSTDTLNLLFIFNINYIPSPYDLKFDFFFFLGGFSTRKHLDFNVDCCKRLNAKGHRVEREYKTFEKNIF